MPEITRQMLRDYLHDALTDTESAMVERAIRNSPSLQKQLGDIREEEDRGEHTIGAIWRRERISCPSREQIGGYLLGSIDEAVEEFISFHLKTIGCPYCQANLDDLQKLRS